MMKTDWNYLPTLPTESGEYIVTVRFAQRYTDTTGLKAVRDIRYTGGAEYSSENKKWFILERRAWELHRLAIPADGVWTDEETECAKLHGFSTKYTIEAWAKLPAPAIPQGEATLIKTVCYGQERSWRSRQEAIDFFLEGIDNSEGSERQRYENIVLKLQNGETYATDAD